MYVRTLRNPTASHMALRSCIGSLPAPPTLTARSSAMNVVTRSSPRLLHRLQFRDQPLDHAEPDLPKGGVARVQAEGRQQFGMMFCAAGREHVEIALGKSVGGFLVDAVKRIHQAIAERIGVDVKRRMNEVRDVGPERLVARP